MKLAEALIQRAELKTQCEQIVSRMRSWVLVQEGDEKGEDVDELAMVYESKMEELERLIIRINKTNNSAILDDASLASAIAVRDCIKAKIVAYTRVKESATPNDRRRRYSTSEIRYLRTTDISQLQKKLDDLSKQYRQLDVRIQACNWNTELF